MPPLTTLHGTALPASALAGKVCLFVNVASKCGFTPQYAGLQALHDRFVEQGVDVIGVPCNQFGRQEPGTAEQIESFCQSNYGVSFLMLNKQDVNGPDRGPLYDWLVNSDVGAGKDIRWNFEKFIVGRDGSVLARFDSRAEPMGDEIVAAVEAALQRKT